MEQADESFKTPVLSRSKKINIKDNESPTVLSSPSEDEKENFKTPLNPSKRIKLSKGPATPLVIPPSPHMKQLGYGTGVNVYLIERFSPARGIYKSPWAVKKINSRLRKNPEFSNRLAHEAKILKTLKHPNIIGFRSEEKSSDGNVCLVMESGQASLGDLIEKRLDDDLGPFPADNILKVAKGISAALHYLHEERHLLHGDLKSGNVLIKDDFSAVKLCDFGVTLNLNDKLTVENNKLGDCCYVGTECWAAPEVVHFETITNKTDMFSFGLILWEMIALFPPHQDKLNLDDSLMDNTNSEKLDVLEMEAEEEYQKALGSRPCIPDLSLDSSYNKVLEIFCLCTEANPLDRPSAKQILETFFRNDE